MTRKEKISAFFKQSELFDYMVTRPLSHIVPNWELTWNLKENRVEPEEDSLAEEVNRLLDEISEVQPPKEYHANEDVLAEYVKSHLNWNIYKKGKRWESSDYEAIINQGSFGDEDQKNLILAAAGRIEAAIEHGQTNFDDMEYGHQKILAMVMASILYQRIDFSKIITGFIVYKYPFANRRNIYISIRVNGTTINRIKSISIHLTITEFLSIRTYLNQSFAFCSYPYVSVIIFQKRVYIIPIVLLI